MYTESLDNVYYCAFSFLIIIELTAERHLIVGTAKPNKHKGILTSKFESKDVLLWKRGSVFVSTDDGKLWIPSR